MWVAGGAQSERDGGWSRGGESGQAAEVCRRGRGAPEGGAEAVEEVEGRGRRPRWNRRARGKQQLKHAGHCWQCKSTGASWTAVAVGRAGFAASGRRSLAAKGPRGLQSFEALRGRGVAAMRRGGGRGTRSRSRAWRGDLTRAPTSHRSTSWRTRAASGQRQCATQGGIRSFSNPRISGSVFASSPSSCHVTSRPLAAICISKGSREL